MKLAFFVLIALSCRVKAEWWDRANFYQIYPRSFMDSNGDGVGDLNGITQRIEYVKEIGIDATWLSPIFQSPMVDFGYDISDFYTIQPEYGTLADFDALVKKCKEIGMHLVLDFVPNHTSNLHEWFIKSENKEPGYEDYYVWHPGKIDSTTGQRVPPNNWISVFRYSAWEWSEKRQEYYLHQFVKEQPDLNYREPKVVEAMKEVLRYWLKRGVSGFRIDAVPYLFEDENLPDEPRTNDPNCDPESACYLQHIYTQDQAGTFDMARQWRKVLDDYTATTGEEKVLLLEAYTSLSNIMKFYGDENTPGAGVPFNFELLSNTNINSTGRQFQAMVDRWMDAMPAGKISNWVLGNHDQHRMSSRLGVGRADVLNIFLQTLPGVAITYYGEEIDMIDVYIPWSETVDPAACNTDPTVFHTFSRDPARTPMQWDDSTNAGFSKADKTWLPVASNYKTNNVELQNAATNSHLKIFKKLTQLRKTEKAFQEGTYEAKIVNDDVVVYRRAVAGAKPYFILLNFGKTAHEVDISTKFTDAANELEVIVASLESGFEATKMVATKSLKIQGEQGVVFRNDASLAFGSKLVFLMLSFYLCELNLF